VPATPDAAWVFNLNGQAPVPTKSCDKGIIHEQLGDLDATAIQVRVTDGQAIPMTGDTGQVSCSVVPSGSGFSIQGSAATVTESKVLEITIPMVTKGATQMSPATGSVSYTSAMYTAGSPFQGNGTCSFYFENSSEGIDSGKFWATFTCTDLNNASEMADCGASPSYVAFENCSSM
jgi:hypothetical protein